MKDIIILGASGFGREVLGYIEEINQVSKEWNVLGFLDDNPYALDGCECDYKVIGSIKDWVPKESETFVLALAFPEVKRKVAEAFMAKGGKFATIVHPKAKIYKHSKIGTGTIISSNSSVSDNASVGDFCTVLSSSVAHDAQVGDYSTLSGRCALNGHVSVGSMVYMGCGVLVAPSKKIGDGAHVGIGSVVIRNVKAGTHVFGNPAKRMAFAENIGPSKALGGGNM